MSNPSRAPIVYSGNVDVRFGELDAYGHVNAKHYLDFVASSRLQYLEREMGCPVEQVMERGVGFYLRRATQTFKRPIVGLRVVRHESFVEKVNGAALVIPYKLTSEDGQTVFSDGVLEYVIVDLKTQRPAEPPAWLLDLFFK